MNKKDVGFKTTYYTSTDLASEGTRSRTMVRVKKLH